MGDVNIRRGQFVRGQPLYHMHPDMFRQKPADFPLPVPHQMGRYHQNGGIGRRHRQKGQGLHGFAQAHFVRQQAAPGPQQKGEPLLLIGQQLPPEGALRRHAGFRGVQGPFPPPGVFPGVLQGLFPPVPIPFRNIQRIAQHQPVQFSHNPPVSSEPGLPPTVTVAAGKQPLGQFRDAGLPLDGPAPGLSVIGKGAVDVLFHRYVPQIRRIFAHGSATPQF